ncbi:MAG: hypothetical protein K0R13_1607 [Propionibacteriaceae bacterium]|jgi:hypothetical protein|nr:hypothetical protein [Propionibacteriaceae bacterium]
MCPQAHFHRGLLESQEQARRSDPIVASVVACNKQSAQGITLGATSTSTRQAARGLVGLVPAYQSLPG